MADDSSSDSERTEEPTPQRREDFRKRGQVAQTRELGSVLTLFGSTVVVYMMSGYMGKHMQVVFHHTMGDQLVKTIRSGHILPSLGFVFQEAALMVAPTFILFTLLALFASMAQVGVLQNEEALKPNFSRINPMEGLKRLFSMKSLVEGLKAVFKVALVGSVVLIVIRQEILVVPTMIQAGVDTVFAYIGDLIIKMLGGVGFLMLILAAGDYAFQRFDLEKKMRMTKQEVKEEMKSREGDPLIKSRIRRIQREMSRQRMMEDVPKADVIVTNPTHLAVALKYDSSTPAPQLIAKGADKVAQKIKEIARENGIPVIENKPLARTIYKTMEIGQVIPRELYKAVAEVLSYVFRLKKRGMN